LTFGHETSASPIFTAFAAWQAPHAAKSWHLMSEAPRFAARRACLETLLDFNAAIELQVLVFV
jgi:hypothetical protein